MDSGGRKPRATMMMMPRMRHTTYTDTAKLKPLEFDQYSQRLRDERMNYIHPMYAAIVCVHKRYGCAGIISIGKTNVSACFMAAWARTFLQTWVALDEKWKTIQECWTRIDFQIKSNSDTFNFD